MITKVIAIAGLGLSLCLAAPTSAAGYASNPVTKVTATANHTHTIRITWTDKHETNATVSIYLRNRRLITR